MKFLSKIKWIVPILLVGIFLLCFQSLFRNWEDDQKKYRTWRLNRLAPRFSYISAFLDSKPQVNKHLLNEAITYYETMAKLYPKMPEALAISGFFYHHLGDLKKARQAYQKSIQLDPNQFWVQYNLGVLSLEEKQYQQAHQTFAKAIAIGPSESIKKILQSPAYRQFIVSAKKKYAFEKSYKQGIQKALSMIKIIKTMAMAKEKQEKLSAAMHIEKLRQNVVPQLF